MELQHEYCGVGMYSTRESGAWEVTTRLPRLSLARSSFHSRKGDNRMQLGFPNAPYSVIAELRDVVYQSGFTDNLFEEANNGMRHIRREDCRSVDETYTYRRAAGLWVL